MSTARILPCLWAVRTLRASALGLGALLGCAGDPSAKPEPTRADASPGVTRPRDPSASRDAASPRDAGALDASEPVAPPTTAGYVRPGLCERPGDDAVRELFCGSSAPAIGSLDDFQELIKISPLIRASSGAMGTVGAGDAYDAGVTFDSNTLVDVAVFLGHSTALSGHLVSPINPRAIVMGSETVMTFQRGVQQVELAALARDHKGFNFYLLSFEQACNQHEAGCRPSDLYTPRIESDWQAVSLRDDEDLKNTALDCRQCHQRGRDEPMLLMRELQSPWTHFFETDPLAGQEYAFPGVRGSDLVQDYRRAKGDEPYSGVAAEVLHHTVGGVLQNLVSRGQPLEFDSPTIQDERWPFSDDGGYPTTPLPSPTWERGYEAFKRGEQLALPYFEPRPTDPEKQARLTEAYRKYRAGELPADELPDLSDIFPDDPLVRAKIGLQTEPDATPAEALIQACGSCHNDVLDQTLSRARFSVALGRMDRAELDRAIERIELAPGTPGVMPPPEGRQLDADGRARLLTYLRDGTRSADDDARLEHAAVVGMTGGALP
jgi:hypothetical protein